MQGDDNNSNSFPGKFFSDGYPGSHQINMVPNSSTQNRNNIPMRWIGESSSSGGGTVTHGNLLQYFNNADPNTSAQNANNSLTWIGESSSRQDIENHINLRRFIGDDFWLNRPLNQSGNSRRTEIGVSDIQNMSLSEFNSFLENSTRSGPCQNNLDLNNVQEESGAEASQGRGSSISPVTIHSGSAGYVIEENTSTEIPDPRDPNRRISCKRRAPENGSTPSPSGSGGSSSLAPQTVSSEHPVNGSLNAATFTDNYNPNRSQYLPGFGVELPPHPNFNQVSDNWIRQAREFRRSTRLRRARGEENVDPISWSPPIHPNVQLNPTTGESSLFSPFNNISNTSSTFHNNVSPFSSLPQPSLANFDQGESSLRNNRRSDMVFGNPNNNGAAAAAAIPRGGSPSNSANQFVNVGEGLGQGDNLINNRRDNNNNMLPVFANMQPNLDLDASFLQSFSSSMRVPQTSPVHQPSSSSLRPSQLMVAAGPFSQALQDIINRSEAWREGNFCPIHSGSSSAREIDPAARDGNFRSALTPLRLGPRADRQAGNASEFSPVLLPQTAAQRRSRMISELRNALGFVRRDGALHLEDVMVIDRSFLFNLPDQFPDVHEDMRLDVDNMSYEELLHLGEQIGDVCTGLSDEAIMANLRRRKYQTIGPQAETEPCVICQEEYAVGEDLSKLDCGHDFHFNCIKQWLVQKNSCPICKKTALAI